MSRGGSTQGGTEGAFSPLAAPNLLREPRGPGDPSPCPATPGCWERRAGCSPQVAADGVQALLEGGHEALLAAFQRLLVPHAILQAVEDPRHAGAQRLDGGDRLGESLQVHPGAQHPVRHLSPGPASLRSAACRGRGGTEQPGKRSPRAVLPSGASLSVFLLFFFFSFIYLFSSFRNVRGFFCKGGFASRKPRPPCVKEETEEMSARSWGKRSEHWCV